MTIKVHIVRTTSEVKNPLCSAPFVVQAFPGARLSDGGPWADLAELRQEQVDVNRWAFFCRGIENVRSKAPRSAYRLVQIDGASRLEVPKSFELEGIVISDASSWDDWNALSKANRWIDSMRKYQLRSGNLQGPHKRGLRLSVLYTVAMAVALLEHQPDSEVDRVLGPYIQAHSSSRIPLVEKLSAEWMRP